MHHEEYRSSAMLFNLSNLAEPGDLHLRHGQNSLEGDYVAFL